MAIELEKRVSDFEQPHVSLERLKEIQSSNPHEASLDKELTARIKEVSYDSILIPEDVENALGDGSSLAATRRVIGTGNSASLDFSDSYEIVKEKTEKVAGELLETKKEYEKTENKTGVSLALLFINLYANYYENVHLPRISSLTSSAHRKNDEIRDLNTLIGHLNSATPDKKGRIDLSEQEELLDRISYQEGPSLLDQYGIWDSKASADTQVEELKGRIQNLTQEVHMTLMDVQTQQRLIGDFFEPTKNTVEKESTAVDRMMQRTGT